MSGRHVLLMTVLAAVATAAAQMASASDELGSPGPAAKGAGTQRPFKIFDGKAKSIVLLTSSHAGGAELFSRVKKMAGSENIQTRQQGYCTDEDGRRDFPSALPPPPDNLPDYCPRKELTGSDPAVLVVLGGALRAKDFPPAPGTCTDQEALARGVQIMCEGVRRAEAKGVEWVMLSTMHYNPNPAWPHCVGWEKAGELVRAYNETDVGKRHPAVDVSTPLRESYPEYFSGDMYHCNAYGRELVAHSWFKALCEWDGLEVPAWSREMVEAARKRDTKDRQGIRDVRAREIAFPEAESRRALEVTWSAAPDLKDYSAEFFRCEQYYAARGGRSGSGRFVPIAGAKVAQTKDGWRLIWPLPASPDPKDPFRNGDHYFIRIAAGRQWNISFPAQLGPGGDPAPWMRRP